MLKTFKKHQKLFSAVILIIYAVVTYIGVLFHEHWYDEAQAWLIVRDNDFAGILDMLKFEGHPPLWYFILFPFVKLGMSFAALSVISWSISVVTAWLVLKKAPFHLGFKTAILFSCGFLFYNSVTARIYCVIVLLLCLLAILYKDRQKHPLLFGLLTGLLAMTHVTMCGLVGIIGIEMLIDFFRGFKANSAKQNLLNTAGLITAGAGVLMLVLPLLSSLSSSSSIEKDELTPAVLLQRFANIFTCIGKSIFPANNSLLLTPLICGIVTLLILSCLFFLRRYKKALTAALVFSVFYFFSTQIIFTIMIPSRASVYLYTLICIFWAAKTSEAPHKTALQPDCSKIHSSLLQKAVQWFVKADRHFEHTISVILCLLCIISIPRGVYQLVRDYFEPYTVESAAAKFLKENLMNENSVLVAYEPTCSALLAAEPALQIYNLGYRDFITYNPYLLGDKQRRKNSESPHPLLNGYQHIYYISISHSNVSEGQAASPVQITPLYEQTIPYADDYIQGYILIYEIFPDQL